jgi:hypothetical protein
MTPYFVDNYYPIGYKKISIPAGAIGLKLSNGETVKIRKITPGCGSFSVSTESYSFTIDGLFICLRDYSSVRDEIKELHHSLYVVSYEVGKAPAELPKIKCHISGDKFGNNFVSMSKKDFNEHIGTSTFSSSDIIEKRIKVYLRERDQFSKILDTYSSTINFDIAFGKLDYSIHPLITNPTGY